MVHTVSGGPGAGLVKRELRYMIVLRPVEVCFRCLRSLVGPAGRDRQPFVIHKLIRAEPFTNGLLNGY